MTNRWPITSGINAVARQREHQRAVESARTQAEAEGLTVVDPVELWADRAHEHQVHRPVDITRARKAGTLVAAASPTGVTYFCTEVVAATRDSRNESPAGQHRAAMKARAAACARLVASPPRSSELTADLARAVLQGPMPYAECLKLTHAWLGDRTGRQGITTQEWRRELAEDASTRTWVAWAMTVAADEVRARSNQPWGSEQITYLQRLINNAGYTPTPWEVDQLSAVYTGTANPPDLHAASDALEGSDQS